MILLCHQDFDDLELEKCLIRVTKYWMNQALATASEKSCVDILINCSGLCIDQTWTKMLCHQSIMT